MNKDIKIIIVVIFALIVIAFMTKYLEQKETETKTESTTDKKGLLNYIKYLFLA